MSPLLTLKETQSCYLWTSFKPWNLWMVIKRRIVYFIGCIIFYPLLAFIFNVFKLINCEPPIQCIAYDHAYNLDGEQIPVSVDKSGDIKTTSAVNYCNEGMFSFHSFHIMVLENICCHFWKIQMIASPLWLEMGSQQRFQLTAIPAENPILVIFQNIWKILFH